MVLDEDSDGNFEEDCPPEELLPVVKFAVTGNGGCIKEDLTGGQVAEFGFDVLLNGREGLAKEEFYSYQLSGDGDGGNFGLQQHSLIAYDKSGNIIAGGVEVLDKEFEQNDKTILGMIRVDVGVARIGLGASWVKSGW